MSILSTTSSSSWSIAIKTVGSRITSNKNTFPAHNNHGTSCLETTTEATPTRTNDTSSSSPPGESASFTLQVHPNDPLHSLSTKIESITGLSPNEQRLIYRGRIISVPPPPPPPRTPSADTTTDLHSDTTTTTTTTIRDISGLSDGETIHLVPRISTPSSHSASTITTNHRNNTTTTNPNNTTSSFQADEAADGIATALIGGLLSGFNHSNYNPEDVARGLVLSGNSNSSSNGGTTNTNVTSLSGSDGMNLLTALLGLGSGAVVGSGGGNNNNNNGNQQQQQQQQQRSRGGERGVTGNTNGQGLGGVVSRAAMMGVLNDGSSSSSSISTTAATAAMPVSSVEGLVAPPSSTAALRSATAAAEISSSSEQQPPPYLPPRTTPSSSGGHLNNRLGTTNPFNPNNHHANNTTITAPPPSSQSAIRAARNRRRATAARLTASDIRVPDPGSMEPVRQGLMTLHTLLRNAELDLEGYNHHSRRQVGMMQHQVDGEEKGEEEEEDLTEHVNSEQQHQQRYHIDRHPLNSHRQWYRGQWLDALDTVNQWLEATIVDIVLPSDLLGNYAMSRSCNNRMRQRRSGTTNVYNDDNISQQQQQHRPVEAVVSGNDLEGRRRLLLEPRPANDNNNNNMMGVYDLLNEGYRPRTDNDGVQLLLIHYNGWPHRWDEWIRSDSPRIRPFRTRTRHRIMSTHASPTPNTVFQAAPPTFIRDESDEVERAELLPELQRVISSVNDVLLLSVLPPLGEERGGMTSSSSSVVDSSHLPWRVPNHGSGYIQSTTANDHEVDNSDDISDDGYYNNSASSSSLRPRPTSQLNAAQLRQLAPLIDRLGRTLTDAAPHIASLADALPPRHSHLPHARPVRNASESLAAQASRLYFGINSENEHDGRSEFANMSDATLDAQVVEVESTVDPDLTDFVNGMVNTTRGGSSSDTNRDPSTSSLLASYLSSIGAGGALSAGGGDNNDNTPRVVRVGGGDGALLSAGGGGGSGIDIHIHAVLTGPGMTPTGLDGLVIGDGGTSVTRNASVGTAVTATPELQQSNGGIDGDEIDHLFSDLYSESPPPVNLHQNQRNNDTENGENLSQIFEECRSIEEESDSIDSSATQPFDGEVVASTNEDAVSDVEEGESSTASGRVDESNDASSIRSRIGTASSLDTRPVATAPGRRRSSTSFGSRMYRRTFGRLSGSSSRRESGT